MRDEIMGETSDAPVIKPERIYSTSRSTLDLTKLNISPTCPLSEREKSIAIAQSDAVSESNSVEAKGVHKNSEKGIELADAKLPTQEHKNSGSSSFKTPIPKAKSVQPRPVSSSQNVKAAASFIPMMSFDGEGDEELNMTPIPVHGYGHHHTETDGLASEYTIPTFKNETRHSAVRMPRTYSHESQSESSVKSQTGRIVSANSFNCTSNQSLASTASHASESYNMFAPHTSSSSAVADQDSRKNSQQKKFKSDARNACATPSDYALSSQSNTPMQSPKPNDNDHAHIHFSDQGFGNIPRSGTPSSLASNNIQPSLQRAATVVSSSSSSQGNERPSSSSPHPLRQLRSPATSVASELNSLSLAHRNASGASLYSASSATSLASMAAFSHGTGFKDSSGAEMVEMGSDAVLAMDHRRRRERNRASARQSRRRRKQYLDILEERVKELSVSMDVGRRQHVACAIRATRDGRRACLQMAERDLFSFCANQEDVHGRERVQRKLEFHFNVLQARWNRMSADNLMVFDFFKEQLKSLVVPPHFKLFFWLSLQNETFFRGGRSSADRLSAARIGEKLLFSGKRAVSPHQGMWPLTCNETGLSYEQEDRFRRAQRKMLADHTSWLTRHSAEATNQVLTKLCRTSQRVGLKVMAREDALLKILNPEQRIRYLNWAQRRSYVTKRIMRGKAPTKQESTATSFKNTPQDHRAAHLYRLAQRLDLASETLPAWQSLVPPSELKKLSRRPMFETLVNRTAAMDKMESLDSHHDPSNSAGSNKKTKLTAEGKDGQEVAYGHMTALEKQQIIPERYHFLASAHITNVLSPIGVPLQLKQTSTNKTASQKEVEPDQALQCSASPDNVLLGPVTPAGRTLLNSPIFTSCPVPMMVVSNINANAVRPKPQPAQSFSSELSGAANNPTITLKNVAIAGTPPAAPLDNNKFRPVGLYTPKRKKCEELSGKEKSRMTPSQIYMPITLDLAPVDALRSKAQGHASNGEKNASGIFQTSRTSLYGGGQNAANGILAASRSLSQAPCGSFDGNSCSTNAATGQAPASASGVAVTHSREVSLLNSPLPTAHDDFMMAVIATSNSAVVQEQCKNQETLNSQPFSPLHHQEVSYQPTEPQYQHHARLSSQAQTDAFLMELAEDDGWAVGDGYDMGMDIDA